MLLYSLENWESIISINYMLKFHYCYIFWPAFGCWAPQTLVEIVIFSVKCQSTSILVQTLKTCFFCLILNQISAFFKLFSPKRWSKYTTHYINYKVSSSSISPCPNQIRWCILFSTSQISPLMPFSPTLRSIHKLMLAISPLFSPRFTHFCKPSNFGWCF